MLEGWLTVGGDVADGNVLENWSHAEDLLEWIGFALLCQLSLC
jgi:hypothetical protein